MVARWTGAAEGTNKGKITRAFGAHDHEGNSHSDLEPIPSRGGNLFLTASFLPMMITFTMLSFVVTFLAGATAGAWLNGLTNGTLTSAPSRR